MLAGETGSLRAGIEGSAQSGSRLLFLLSAQPRCEKQHPQAPAAKDIAASAIVPSLHVRPRHSELCAQLNLFSLKLFHSSILSWPREK